MIKAVTTNVCCKDEEVKYYNNIEEIKRELIEDIVYYHDFNGKLIEEMVKEFDPWIEELLQDLKTYERIKSPSTIEEMNKLFEYLSDSYYLTILYEDNSISTSGQ